MIRPLKAGSKGFMPLDRFKQSAEFAACTPKQQIFILKLIETKGDYTLATLTAYQSKGARQAGIFSCVVRRMDHVKAALDLYLGRTAFDILYDEVETGLKAAEPGSVSYQRMLSQKERLLRERAGLPPVKDADEPEAPKPPTSTDPRIPDNVLKVWVDGNNVVIGFRDANGQDVRL